MKLLKGLLSAACALTLCAQLSATVFADDTDSANENDNFSAVIIDETEMPEFTGDDPSYWKYYDKVTKSGAVYGSSNLTHNSKFSNVDKSYGIDVSYFQTWKGDIDWKAVKNSGIKYVIVRLGYRGYGSAGTLMVDDDFHKNIRGAMAAGLDVGVYFFSQAVNTAEAKAEAQFCINELEDYYIDLPVYLDVESIDYDTGRLDSANLSKSTQTSLCRTFCDTMINAGFYAGIYANNYYLTYKMDGASLGKDYPIWLAEYSTKATYTGDYDVWQYTGYGSVDGVPTYVDMNVMYDVDHAPTGSVKVTKSGTTLSWNKVTGADGYAVYSKDPSGSVKRLKFQTGTSYTVTSGSGLSYYVKAYKSYGGQKYYGSSSNSVSVSLGKVSNLTQTEAIAGGAKISWSAVSGASGYEIYTLENGSYKLYSSVSGTSAFITGITAGESKSVKVRAYSDGKLYGDYSSVVTIKSNPASPAQLSVKSASTNSVSVSWTANSGNCDGYEISLYDGKNYTAVGTSSKSEYTFSGLSTATNYKAAVRAYIEIGGKKYYGTYSKVTTFTTAPAAAKGLTVKDFGNHNSVRLSWTKTDGASSYQIYYVEGGTEKFLANASSNSAVISNLRSNCTYNIKVRAVRTADGQTAAGSFSNMVQFKMQYAVPDGLAVTDYNASGFTISWQPVKYCTGYEIYKYDNANRKYVLYKTVDKTASSAYVGGLSASSSCRVAVKAVYGSTSSEYSNYLVGYSKLNKPAILKTVSLSSGTANISWSSVKSATGYKVYLYDEASGTFKECAQTTSARAAIKGLKAGKEYKIRVRAIASTSWKTYYSDSSDCLKFTAK